MSSAAKTIIASMNDAHRVLTQLLAQPNLAPTLDAIAHTLISAVNEGRTLLICGNGGSLCDAVHFAEELTGRFRADRPPLAAIACADAGHITCTANDYGFDEIFARWTRALGKPGDVLIVLSTSGNSPNIIKAIKAAQDRGLKTVALLGKSGGALQSHADHELIVPGATSDRIQELHMLILHALVEVIEIGVAAKT